MRITGLLIALITSLGCQAQQAYRYETSDIHRFWQAYDQLRKVGSHEDSLRIIQETYLDQASSGFTEFLKKRDFTANEYVKVIGQYPRYWHSLRPLSLRIDSVKADIDEVFLKLAAALPDFRQPDICFAMGPLRTGGTTTEGLILIGADIAAANGEVDKSEMTGWRQRVLGNTGDLVAMVAHETIHTQQHSYRKTTLLTASLKEGIADFLTELILGLNINQKLHEYADPQECQIWKEFEADLGRKTLRPWLYGGNAENERPADLGYYIGYKIAEAYYNQHNDKQAAIRDLLNQKKYPQIFRQSQYAQRACSQ